MTFTGVLLLLWPNTEPLGASHTTKPFLGRGAKSGIEATEMNIRPSVYIYILRGDLPILRAPALAVSTLRSDGFPSAIL